MFFPLLAFSSYLHFIDLACAQVNVPNCTDSDYTWSLNTLQQSPCMVAAQLQAVCSNGTFTIHALQIHNVYIGPEDGDQCMCNTVVYNLVSACGACQGGGWNNYSTWSVNCTTKASPGTYPEPVPDGTRVPQWAYIDTSSDTWDALNAEGRGDFPESTASIIPTSTSTGGGPSSTSTSTSSSNTGILAGGVVGAVLILGFVIVAWFVVCRRRARSLPSDTSGQGGEMEQPTTYPPPTIETPRPYVSDSLFPLFQQRCDKSCN